MAFLNDEKFNWKKINQENAVLFYKGSKQFAAKALDICQKDNPEKNLTTHLKKIDDFSSGVVETPLYIIAWVDHIRSWPLFYTQENSAYQLSQNAYRVKENMVSSDYDENCLIEFKMSGYVTGSETLVKNLYSLNPGEFSVWNKQTKVLSRHKYYSYIPTFDSKIPKEEVIKNMDHLFDHLTKKIISRANNKTIWIPLSGGFDSRILLCKLHQHGYKSIQTFTYGPRFNFESFIAKKVAKKLDVPWRFVAPPRKILKSYFKDDDRKKFWDFAGNLKTIPCMRDYGAVRYLHETQQIDKDAIFLNGQSGDYITGGHLSTTAKNKTDYNRDDFYNIIINKHYDLWKHYRIPENINILKQRIDSQIYTAAQKPLSLKNNTDGAVYEEIWEYEGRQICYVANGQRIYEYYGYNWEMPLWEKEFVDFFEPLPFDMKYEQKIYKEYLRSYNYLGLFPEKEPYIWRWPLPMIWVVPLARIIGLVFGHQRKENFYAFMRYWGHYANQYNFFDWDQHKKTYQSARNVIALYVPEWIKNHRLSF